MRCLLVDDNEAFIETAAVFLTGWGEGHRHGIKHCEALLRPANCSQMSFSSISCSATKTVLISRAASPRAARDLAVIMISSDTEDDYADLVAESPALGFLPRPSFQRMASGGSSARSAKAR